MIVDLNNYPNLLDEIAVSSAEIEAQLSTQRLSFDNYKNEEVEWKLKLPMFVYTFYKIVIETKCIPSQQEFWKYYSSQNELTKLLESRISDREDIERGIKARLFRTYPSLIRDLHFSVFLSERIKNNAKVIYNIQLDVEVGIDILVEFNENFYAVNLFTPTMRARQGREKKEYRHQKVSNVHQIELPVEFKTERKCGDFFLYGEKELLELKQLFKQKIQDA